MPTGAIPVYVTNGRRGLSAEIAIREIFIEKIRRRQPTTCVPHLARGTILSGILHHSAKLNRFVSSFCSLNILSPFAWLHMTTISITNFVAAVAEWYRYWIVACLVMSSSPVPLKTYRVGQRCTLNLSKAETSSRWCGVIARRGGARSGIIHVP
ncbi:uncharacterized protein TNCV_2357151 [Trichonephila clavipes]|nr:uncharacterized protein TNCV_2357151 [Trichonephila clavipes]